ncbi:hypothetical protein D3C81_1245830 [compost metagenome]
MKKVLLYFLTISLLVQASWGYVVIGAFYVNKDYIAKYLCENRDKPQLHCNGNCVLMKKIRKAQEKEKQNPTAKLKAEVYDFINSYALFFFIPASVEIKSIPLGPVFTKYHSIDSNRLFRPPIAA